MMLRPILRVLYSQVGVRQHAAIGADGHHADATCRFEVFRLDPRAGM
jgi:hypothetical protein